MTRWDPPPIIEDLYEGEYAYVRIDLAPTFREAVRVYTEQIEERDWLDGGTTGMFPAPKPSEPGWWEPCALGKGTADYRKLVM
jgi:hypothetical protein